MEQNEFIKIKDVSKMTGFAVSYLRKLVMWHKIPYYQPTGRALLFKRSDIVEFLEQSRVPADYELNK